MSSSEEPQTEILREGDEYDALRHDYLQGLRERFILTGDVKWLATFISEGGDLGKYGLLDEVAARLDGTKEMKKTRGGPKDERNLTLYLDVCNRIAALGSRISTERNSLSAAIRYVCSIKKPDADADYDTKAEYKRVLDAATKRFKKGKTLFKKQRGRALIECEN